MYNIIQKRKIWLTMSGAATGLAIISLFIWRLNFGIDFTGGSLLEVKYFSERPTVAQINQSLAGLDLKSLTVQPVGDEGLILRFQDTSEEKHQAALSALDRIGDTGDQTRIGENGGDKAGQPAASGTQVNIASPDKTGGTTAATGTKNVVKKLNRIIEELRFSSVGPSIGNELKRKSLVAIFFVVIAIAAYIAWVFRKVSRPVESWKYGVAAVIALFHDVLFTVGAFSILGHFYNIEINTPFVAAFLTVLGFSVHDTIVVFDRIRENLPKSDVDFENTVNASVNQTLARSINTSLTVLLVLLSILFFGGGSIKDFVLALCIGIFIGTYSSIFVASPILVIWEKASRKT